MTDPTTARLSRRALGQGALGALALGVLSACKSSQPATTASGSTGSEATSGAASGSASTGAISVTDSRGKTVTLDAPATKVVALEWLVTEDLITLGVQPVGVADAKGYAEWDTAATLTGSPVEIGTRTQPSVEAVAKAGPDLIIGIENSIPSNALAQMEKIAPVVVLSSASTKDQIGLVKQNLATIGKLVGKDAEATAKNAELDAKLAAAKTKLAAKGSLDPVMVSFITVTGNTVSLRVDGPVSLPGAVAKQIGLTNAYTGSGDSAYGIGSLDLEGLTKLPSNTQILYWTNKTLTDPVKTSLAKNATWLALPSVKAGKVHPFGNGVWLYGGTASTMQIVDQFTTLFA